MQIQALVKAGVDEGDIWSEKRSASAKKRPGLENCLDYLEPGGTLVVWKLDRLGRSMIDLLKRLEWMEERGIKFKSLTEDIDTNTPGGQLLLHVLMALAQFERDLIKQRSKAGMEAKMATGWIPGPKRKLTQEEEQQIVKWREECLDAAQIIDKVKEIYGKDITRRLVYLTWERHKDDDD